MYTVGQKLGIRCLHWHGHSHGHGQGQGHGRYQG